MVDAFGGALLGELVVFTQVIHPRRSGPP
jgi:hypothetical protein